MGDTLNGPPDPSSWQMPAGPVTGTPAAPQGQTDGFMGQSPGFWNNLANFGANLSVASSARGPRGELLYGGGLGGPLGAATLANQQFQQQNPFLRAELQRKQLENQGLGLQNQLTVASLPFQYAKTAAGLAALGGGSGSASGVAAGSINQQIAAAERSPSNSMNPLGYAGTYQQGAAELADAGVYKPAPRENLAKNEWKGQFSIAPFNNATIGQFLQNPSMQEAAFNAHIAHLNAMIPQLGLNQYEGQTIGGIPITRNVILGGMHLAGPTGMKNWLESGGKVSPPDQNGTDIPKYVRMMGATAQQGAPVEGASAQVGPDQGLLAQSAAMKTQADLDTLWNPEKAKAGYARAQTLFDAAYAPQKAAAIKSAELPFTANTLRGEGSVLAIGGKPVIQIPEKITGVDQHGRTTTRYVQPLEGQGGSQNLPAPFVSALAPGEHEAIEESSKDLYSEQEKKQYQSAQASLAGTANISADLADLNKRYNWANTGPGSESLLGAANWVNSAIARIGIAPAFDPSKIASDEDLRRQTKLAGDQLTNQFFGGAREAAATIMNSQSLTNYKANSPQGAFLGVANMREVGRMGIDRHNFMINWATDPKNEGDVRGAEEAFYKARPPETYALRARSMIEPIPTNLPGGLDRLLPGTWVMNPNGKKAMVGGNPDIVSQSPVGQ